MRTYLLSLLMFLLLGGQNAVAAKTSFFISTSANSKEAESYASYFETRIFSDLKKDFPCVEISSRSTVLAVLEHERQRQLLSGVDRDLATIGEAMGSEYFVSLKVRILQGTVLLDAFCANTRTSKVISRASGSASSADAGLDAVERASKQLVEGLKKYEICPFKGPINVSVKTERNDREVESYGVYCNGVDGVFRREENIISNSEASWKLNKTRKYVTTGSLTYSLYEESGIEEQNSCALCPNGKKGARVLSEKIVKRAGISGLSNESVAEGAQIDDARTEITFSDDGTYTIKIQAASKKGKLTLKTDRTVEGSCERSHETETIDKKADVPLNEILGPFNGTSLDDVLSGSKTIVREDPDIKEKTTITFDFTLRKE